MEKKKLSLIKVILAILIILPVGIYIVLNISATIKADKLMENIKRYEVSDNELITGKYVDFSSDKNEFSNAKVQEGIVHVDKDGRVQILSNIKIGGFYCTFNQKTKCNLFIKKDTDLKEVKEYTEYKVGDAVTLKDDTKWHVIHNSDKYSKYIILLRDERVDYNEDGITIEARSTSDPDRIPFDVNMKKEYDIKSEGNIGYYIENTYKLSLTKLNNIREIRLLTTKEYEAVKEAIGFTELTEQQIQDMIQTEEELFESIKWMYEYPRPVERIKNMKISAQQSEKLMPHWLHNSSSGNFWVIKENGKPCTAVWSGDGYTTPKPTTGYSLKPVMVIEKSNVQ